MKADVQAKPSELDRYRYWPDGTRVKWPRRPAYFPKVQEKWDAYNSATDALWSRLSEAWIEFDERNPI